MTPTPVPPLSTLLKWDRDTSYLLYRLYNAHLPRLPLLILEISGHGLLWLILPLLLYLLPSTLPSPLASILLNLLLLTLLDLAVVGVLKPAFARPRPAYNSGIGNLTIHAVDQYSFPSGHATRAGCVAGFVIFLKVTAKAQLPTTIVLAIVMWALCMVASRVVLGRHHVVDVIIGFLIGLVYILVWDTVWVGEDVANQVRESIRHALEKIVGAK